MAVTINASTSNGLIQTADTSGIIQLQSNGTTVATAQSTGFQVNTYTPATSLITSGTSQATTSGTSITFTGIPSWVKRITVMFNGVSTNGTSPPLVRLGTSSGSVSTGYLSGSNSYGGGSTGTATNQTTGFGIGATIASSSIFHGIMIITNITGNTWVQGASIGYSDSAYAGSSGGSVTLSGTLTQLIITTVSGTQAFTAGAVNILYE